MRGRRRRVTLAIQRRNERSSKERRRRRRRVVGEEKGLRERWEVMRVWRVRARVAMEAMTVLR